MRNALFISCFLALAATSALSRDYKSLLDQTSEGFEEDVQDNRAALKERAAEEKRLAAERRQQRIEAANGTIKDIRYDNDNWLGTCGGGMFFSVFYMNDAGDYSYQAHSDLGIFHGGTVELAAIRACGG